jgi:hypothetical protein
MIMALRFVFVDGAGVVLVLSLAKVSPGGGWDGAAYGLGRILGREAGFSAAVE